MKPVKTECVEWIDKWLAEEKNTYLLMLLQEYLWQRKKITWYPTGYRYEEPTKYVVPNIYGSIFPMIQRTSAKIIVEYWVDKEVEIEARRLKKFIKQRYNGK